LPETKVSKNGSVAQYFTEDAFSKILSYSIKEGMQFLGGSPKQAVIVYIEKKHSMKEDEATRYENERPARCRKPVLHKVRYKSVISMAGLQVLLQWF